MVMELAKPAFAGHDGLCRPGPRRVSYFTAPKRLSNEFGGTIGAEPET